MKHKWEIDVPVLLIFFARYETFEKVFEAVRKARPSTLLLWQDGPREKRPDDIEGIERCREIAENIDWDCTVHKMYHDQNMGCDPSTFLAQKWAFTLVEKCIIMEDDRIPCETFFSYCKELLDKYENDERVNHICGTNLLGEYKSCDADYFFAPFGSTTWATWRRVAQEWDENYSFLEDNEQYLRCLKRVLGEAWYKNVFLSATKHKKDAKQYWETILGWGCMLNNRVAIIPKKNMIMDIGLTENSTHATANRKIIGKKALSMFYMKAHDVSFPLKHPRYLLPDWDYVDEIAKFSCIGHPLLRMWRRVAYIFRCIFYGEFGKRLKKKLAKHREK